MKFKPGDLVMYTSTDAAKTKKLIKIIKINTTSFSDDCYYLIVDNVMRYFQVSFIDKTCRFLTPDEKIEML